MKKESGNIKIFLKEKCRQKNGFFKKKCFLFQDKKLFVDVLFVLAVHLFRGHWSFL